MKKKALLALLLCAVLVFSGCSIRQKNVEVDAAQPIITVNGESIDKQTVANALAYRAYDTNVYYYMNYGYNLGVTADQVQSEVIDEMIRNKVEDQKAAELGFGELTEDEEKSAEEVGKSAYEYYSLMAYYYGMDPSAISFMYDQKDLATEEDYVADAKRSVRIGKLMDEIVKDVVLEDSDASAVEEAYNTQLDEQKQQFTDAPAFASAYNNGSVGDIYYAPEGIRFVKQVLVAFAEEDQTLIDEATDAVTTANTALNQARNALNTKIAEAVAAEQQAYDAADQALTEAENKLGELAEDADKTEAEKLVADAQAALDEAGKVLDAAKAAVEAPDEQAAVEAAGKTADEAQEKKDAAVKQAHLNIADKAQEVCTKARAGEDLNALIEEYNSDPGMTTEPFGTTGYAVCEGYTDFDAAFVEGAMALANPGDISDPVESDTYGYYVLVYMSDLQSGERTLDEVRESAENSALNTKRSNYYSEQLQSWVDAAEVKTFTDRLAD